VTRLAAWVLAVITALVWLMPAAPARAKEPPCNEARKDCVVEDDSGGSSDSDSGDSDSAATEKVTPDCNALGVAEVGPVGVTLADLGIDDPAHEGWVRVVCTHLGEDWWAWMDPGAAAESIARTLLARLQLQPIKIGWTPLGADSMGYVGVPTWLWVDDPSRVTWGPATIRAGGVSLTARAESVTWSMGTGDQVRCANKGTVWAKGMGAGPSPTCGYTYQQQGSYRVTATAHWVARWSGYGRSGEMPLNVSQERTLEVGEIQVIVNR